MTLDILEKMGLSSNEAKVYLALIELGSSTAGKISERSGVNRRTVYDVLESLMDKGLVSFVIEANRRWFEASDPRKFLEILKQRGEEMNKILPELIKKRDRIKEKQEATIYRGKKGVKTIFEDILRSKENWVFGSHGRFKEVFPYFFKHYQRKKRERRIYTRLLLSERKRNSEIVRLTPGEHRFLRKEYDSPTSTIIYGDKVAIIVWTDEPMGLVLKGDQITKSFRNYFEVMWRIAKK
jgi:sugar-specific transcriptional regulator TrmB